MQAMRNIYAQQVKGVYEVNMRLKPPFADAPTTISRANATTTNRRSIASATIVNINKRRAGSG